MRTIKTSMSVFFLLVSLLFRVIPALSQNDSTLSKSNRLKVYPFPAIGYSPETRWYFGAVTLFSKRLSPDPVIKQSTLKLEFNWTQNKQFIYTENHEIRFPDNKILLTGENGFFRYPEYYWEPGADSEDESKLNYNANRIEIDNSFLIRTLRSPFIGLRYRYHYVDIISSDNPDLFPYDNSVIHASGLGPVFVYDSRDNVLNASRGFYGYLSFLFFGPNFNSDDMFRRMDIDCRYYLPFKNRSTLAFQIISSHTWGEVPFRMLPLVGGDRIMRGYYLGRYRDNHLTASQTEYRFPVWKWIGITTFTGAGMVYGKASGNSYSLKKSYGLGLRIRLDKKDNVNLRFDYGIGEKSNGFYVAFGEAF